jgi:DeoR family transcriptional regulator, aga operon transcriptional repressor
MRDLHANHLFLGVDGIDPEAGPSTPDILEAQLNGMMMRAAEEVTIVADSSKFGRRSLSVIGSIDRVARIITDTGIDPAVSEVLHRRGIKMIVV